MCSSDLDAHRLPARGGGDLRRAEPGAGHLDPGDELVVWGSGRQSRSFLYVSDFADGLIRVCERAPDATPVNVGADEESTIGAVAQIICDLAGTGKRAVFDTSKPEGQPRRHCDVSRLREAFDFAARVPLVDGLAETVDRKSTRLNSSHT